MNDNSKTKEQLSCELLAARQRIAELELAVTERKKVEEALRESEDKFRSLTESTTDWIGEVDNRGIYTYSSPKVKQMLGYEPAEVMGKSAFDFMPPEEAERVAAEFGAIAEFRKPFDGLENTNLHKTGRPVVLETSGVPIFDANGNFRGYRGIDRDITERKRMEEAQIMQAAALAREEELQRSRQRIIKGQESLRRDIAQQLHGSVQNRLIVLLHRLTELERAASPGELAAEMGNLRQQLGDLLDTHVRPISRRLYPSILHRGLVPALQSLGDQYEASMAIEVELDEELVRQEKANPQLISEQVRLAAFRVAEEALTNVVKHTKASRVTIGLELSSEGWLRLRILDNGQGFDVGSASRGLGILMMQDYTEVVDGRCVIHSALDEGTSVIATFPLVEPGGERPGRASPLE